MSQGHAGTAATGMVDMFDEEAGSGPVCRVCGALVAASEVYRQAHWDWHEASNGA